MFTLTDISVALFATSTINFIATIISWRRRATRSGLYFALGMTGVTFWTLAAGLDYAAVSIPLKVFFAKLEYTGYNLAFACFLLFVLSYAGYEDWLDKGWIKPLLGIVPFSTILLAWTNDWHGLLWSGFIRSSIGDNTVIFEHGPGYLWAAITGYLMIAIIIGLLWQASYKGSELSYKQARLLFFASLIPVLGNLVYLFQTPELKGVDWTPITFSASGLLFLLALYGSRLLDLAPIARDQLVNSLSDGMIVLDTQKRIIDINQSAVRLLDLPQTNLLGKELAQIVSLPRVFETYLLGQEINTEVEFDQTPRRYFDVLFSPLRDRRERLVGSLIIFRDITERKENELRLLQLTQAVEQSPTSVMVTDVNGDIIYINPQFTFLTGYARSEVIGRNANIVQSGQTADEVYQEMWQTIRAGETWHGEFLNCKKNGEFYWENVVIAPVMDQDGQILNFIAVKEDITERKRADDELRNANQQLARRLKEIETLQATLREQALRDPLTKLHNRRFLDESIEQEFHHAKRASEFLSIILIDLDHFKVINDTHGHAVGDICLIALADIIQQHIRRADIFCRYGGEEFMLVLPATNLQGAAQHAEKLRRLVAEHSLTVDGRVIQFTISLGIACYPADGETPAIIIKRADDAMYSSKRAGRNRVTLWSQAD